MKYIVLTVLVCMDVAVFSALYLRATEIVTHAIVEGLSEISVATESLSPARSHRNLLGYRCA